MAITIRPAINNQIFSWAIARNGIPESEVISRYPKFLEWKNGQLAATVNQLKDFSNTYHFPFGYFFLKQVPDLPKNEIPFFRKSDDYSAIENENVNETVRILKERQEWLSEYLKDMGNEKNPILGLCKDEHNPIKIVNAIYNYLNLEYDWNLKLKTPEEALKVLKTKLEEKNIIVTFNSIVKNNSTRPIPVKLCRGFCLIDDYVPFIFINSADSKKAQLFTIIHELTHIFISFSSGFGDFGSEILQDSKESLCDSVAANFLVPEELLLEYQQTKSNAELSDLFKTSEIVILRRKLDCKIITSAEFFAAYNALPQYKKSGSGGGNFYSTAKQRISPKLLICLSNAMHERVITPLEAYRLAGVKGDVFTKLVAEEIR